LRERGGIVRGLYFDKPAGTGWALPWHRDTTIAIKAHGLFGRFAKPTVKAGVPHVEAPRELLSTMVTARIHLDDMTDDNGPLRVIPGSHVRQADDSGEAGITLRCAAGDVLLMRPLVLHASGHCAPWHTGSRRVVHLEFAPDPQLPDGCEWQTFIPLTSAPASPAAGLV
jgi:ectoine hydroxylase-related dioxygenase (phytanoyl-CoA dioxygenase family)